MADDEDIYAYLWVYATKTEELESFVKCVNVMRSVQGKTFILPSESLPPG